MKQRIMLLILFITLLAGLPVGAQDAAPSSVRINEVIPDEAVDGGTSGRPITLYFVVLGQDENEPPLPNPSLIEEGAQVIVSGQDTAGEMTGVTFPATLRRYDGPTYVAVAVDNSQSMKPYMTAISNAFVGALERKPAQMALALRLFSQESEVAQDFTAGPSLLQEGARGLVAGEEQASCLYDAAFAAAESLSAAVAESPQAMRAVVLIGDGINNGRCQRRDDQAMNDLITFADENHHRIAFYSVRFGNVARPEDVQWLERLTAETGGAAYTFQDEQDLTDRLAGIMTGLNTQWTARATVFTPSDGPVSVNLGVSARGEGDVTAPLPAQSLTVALGHYPPPIVREKRLFIDSFNYADEERVFLITVQGDNLTAADCATLRLLDATNEKVGEQLVCWQNGESRQTVSIEAPRQETSIELYSDDVPLPEDKEPGEPLDVATYVPEENLPPPTFRYRVTPVGYEGLQIDLSLVPDLKRDDSRLDYQVDVEAGGVSVYAPGWATLDDAGQPIDVAYYPEEAATDERATVAVDIAVTLRWPDGVVSGPEEKKGVTLYLRPRAGAFERLTKALRANPIILWASLLILLFAALYFVAMRRLNRLNSAVVWSPVRGPTQVPPQVSGVPAEPPLVRDPAGGGQRSMAQPVARARSGHDAGYGPESPIAPPTLMAHPPMSATLRVLRAPDAARQNEIAVINRFPFRIGREGCELTLGDGRTSRHQASIQQIGDQLVIIDKNSKNGTFLNDAPTPLTPGMRWPLQDGDRIRLGTTIELQLAIHPPGDSPLAESKPTEP